MVMTYYADNSRVRWVVRHGRMKDFEGRTRSTSTSHVPAKVSNVHYSKLRTGGNTPHFSTKYLLQSRNLLGPVDSAKVFQPIHRKVLLGELAPQIKCRRLKFPINDLCWPTVPGDMIRIWDGWSRHARAQTAALVSGIPSK